MNRPDHLKPPGSSSNVRTKGIPSNSQDVIHAHAQAIEQYIFEHVGERADGSVGNMYFNRTLEDWIGYRIDKRTKFDLTISSGLALLAAQKVKVEKKVSNFDDKKFFRRYKPNA
jgi:ribosomal protein S3AE